MRLLKANHFQAASPGLTLVEVALCVVIIAVFVSFAVAALLNQDENGDATQVESIQASLQSIVIQAADRLNTSPVNVNRNSVLQVMPSNNTVNLEATGNGFQLRILESGRQAQYRVNNCGQVCVSSVTGFSKYTLRASANSGCSADPQPCNILQRQ